MRTARTLLVGLLLVGALAACSDDDEPGAAPAPAAPPASALPERRVLTVAAFNVLGGSHTAPGGDAEAWGWPRGPARAAGVLERVRRYRPDLVAFQELQRRQAQVVRDRLGPRWGYHADLDNALVWRRGLFDVLDRRTLSVPYFYENLREMPVLVLRHRPTGAVLTVVSLHNPADVRGDAAASRAEAIRRERDFVREERAAGRSVLLLGDLNAREEAFCPLTRGGLLVAANGGSHRDGTCTLPEDDGIDWILGSGVTFNGHLTDTTPPDEQVSDHPFLVATLSHLVPG